MKIKKYGCQIALVLVVTLLGLAVYGVVQVHHNLIMSLASPYLFVSLGATKDYQAHFIEEGFQDRDISLFVLPSSDQQAVPKLVAHLVLNPNYFGTAVWSRDGSVIAHQMQVVTEEDAAAESAKRLRNEDQFFVPNPCYLCYFCAYDFRQGKSFVFKPTGRYGSRHDWDVHSNAIKELLDSRGGLGKKITSQEIQAGRTKLDWEQWQVYERAM